MKQIVKLSRQGHKTDNGPGDYNETSLHLSQVEFSGVRFKVGGRPINMYGYPLSVVGSGISVHGGASLKITKEPSSPSPCKNPVPRGIAMNLNRRGEWNSFSQGEWDGEGVVDIDDNLLLLLQVALRIERKLDEEHAATEKEVQEKRSRGEIGLDKFGAVRFGKPSIMIRYPRRGRYPYITFNVCYSHQEYEGSRKASEWVGGIVGEEMAKFKWPEIPSRVPRDLPQLGEVPGDVADVLDDSNGRELRRALEGRGGSVINDWLDSLSQERMEKIASVFS